MCAEKLRQYFEEVRKRINNKITCNGVFNIWEEFNDTVREFGPYEHYSSFSEFLIFSIVKKILKERIEREEISGEEFFKDLRRKRGLRNVLQEVEKDVRNLNTVESIDNLIKNKLKDDRYDKLREILINKRRDMLRKYRIKDTKYKVYLDHRYFYRDRKNITPDLGFFKIEEDGEKKKEKFLGAIEVKVYPAFGISTVRDYIENKLNNVAKNTKTNFSILYIIFHKVSNNFREKLNQWEKNKGRSWSIKFLVLEANNNSIYDEVKNFLKNLNIIS